jgi:Uma2 family endonuclease
MVLLELSRLSIPPGQRVLLHDVSWQEFELILQELGDHRSARIAYENGILEIMTPLPEHEAAKEVVGDLVKALLEELDIEFLTLGSTTFKNPAMFKGIEPDQCFYIQNELAVRGKRRLDLVVDPPSDLALEIDITSRTHPSIYQALGVPELWRFDRGNLQINVLRQGKYVEVEHSSIFPGMALKEAILEYLQQSRTAGRNATMKAFRQWVRESIKNS